MCKYEGLRILRIHIKTEFCVGSAIISVLFTADGEVVGEGDRRQKQESPGNSQACEPGMNSIKETNRPCFKDRRCKATPKTAL